MAPRHQTLPPAQTSSAREALQSFYCNLCSKGYSRMNDYEAHLSSYDHTHKQRLKDMKAMVKDPGAGARARKAEAKADGIISIKLSEGEEAPAAGSGFKKGGFKKAGFKSAFASAASPAAPVGRPEGKAEARGLSGDDGPGAGRAAAPLPLAAQTSDSEDDDYERYNPRFPTD
ncbi:uncharacterized protein DNG_10009 [Cephalotrichum gorgonifer]|uniref:C2H2-type domain-containing protein n=1 Tax=Cephalotrichum gorgonifer TaxID=2041049 RepID=A0AAE8N957_9PEZI|nr:uncharacterized protein DNG_10009 [Cephalotrichum gorgonifer]